MTINEFKAWFEGYTENITKLPTQKQWARIKERVDEIDAKEGKWEKIIYRDHYRPWWPEWYTYSYTSNDINFVSESTNFTLDSNNDDKSLTSNMAYAVGVAEGERDQLTAGV